MKAEINSPSLSFDVVFSTELLKAEYAKTTALAGITAVMALVASILFSVFGFDPGTDGLVSVILACMMMLSALELGYRWLLGQAIEGGPGIPHAVPYLVVLMEISMPTVVLALGTSIMGSASALSAPPTMVYAIFIGLTALRLDWRLSVFAGALAALQYAALSAWALPRYPVMGPLLDQQVIYGGRAAALLMTGVATGVVAKEIRTRVEQSLHVIEERNWVVGVFGRYLTDDVVDVLLNAPEGLAFGGEKRRVTLMMTDLRGFSGLSEDMAAESLVAMLNHYLGEMTTVILEHGGTIDEFIGDAILVIFGAPIKGDDDADRAVACAIAMQRRMASVNAWNVQHGYPVLEMGIGINTGRVVVGNIGSERRSKYGVVGSEVNTTARIESYTVGGQVLISASTHRAVHAKLMIERTFTAQAKGVREPLEIFDVVGLGEPYDVALLLHHEPLVALDPPVRAQVQVLVGKDVSEQAVRGRIVQISHRELLLDSSVVVHDLTNLRLDVEDVGEVLGKVTGLAPIRVRITSKSKEAQRWLDGLLPDEMSRPQPI